MINKVGIQLYSDLVILGVLVFLKSPCTSLGPGQSTSSVLAAPIWQEWQRGTSISSLLSFLSLSLLDLVKELHKAVPGSVPALWEVPAGWSPTHVEGLPNPRGFPWHLQAVGAQSCHHQESGTALMAPLRNLPVLSSEVALKHWTLEQPGTCETDPSWRRSSVCDLQWSAWEDLAVIINILNEWMIFHSLMKISIVQFCDGICNAEDFCKLEINFLFSRFVLFVLLFGQQNLWVWCGFCSAALFFRKTEDM